MGTDSDCIVEFAHISKSFSGARALKDVSLCIPRHGIHAIVGENGAGKSTLMKILAGNYSADDGKIIYDQHEVSFRNPREANDSGIFMVYQDLSLASELSVSENVYAGREPRKHGLFIDWKAMGKQSFDLMEMLGLQIDPTSPVGQLLMGERQLVEVLKAISMGARLLVLDEPTSALSQGEVDRLFSVLRQLRDRGTTIIYITHRIDEVFALTDDIHVLRDGCYVGSGCTSQLTREDVIQMEVGRELTQVADAMKAPGSKTALRVEGLSCPGRFRDVNFEIAQGEILGLYGLLGSGRKEVGEALFGMVPRTSGSVFLDDKLLHIRNPIDAISRGIAYVPEDRRREGLFLGMSVKQNIASTNLKRFTEHVILNHGKVDSHAREWVDKLAIKCTSPAQIVGTLSGGNQQKVVMAKWLSEMCTRLIIVDEPTAGTDIGAKWDIHSMLRGAAESGVGVLLISSELEEIMGISHRIAVMRNGIMVGILERSEFSKERIVALSSD